MKIFHFFSLIIVICFASTSSEESATDLLKGDVDDLLLLSTLDGTVICVERSSGQVRWKLKDEPVIRVPLKGDNVPMPLFLPDPKDGSLYVVKSTDREAVKKLPLTIPQLVASSPCRSTDGIIYTGKKLDTWFSINPQTGAKKTLLTFDSADKSCPREGPDSIFIGRTEYNLVMMDSRKKEKTWNVTFYDYTSFAMDSEGVQNYDLIHFTGSSSGRVVTLHRNTDSLLWQLDLESPVIAMYLFEARGLLNVPFTNIADSTLDLLLSDIDQTNDLKLGIEFKTSNLELYPTLYIGENRHGLYAFPSLADQNTAAMALEHRGPPLLEGPTDDKSNVPQNDRYSEGKFKIIRKKYTSNKPSPEEIKTEDSKVKDRAVSFIFLGHYRVPNTNDDIPLQIEGKKDIRKIIENETNVFAGNKKGVYVQTDEKFNGESLSVCFLQLRDLLSEIRSFNISYQTIKKLLKTTINILHLTIMKQENVEIKIAIALLIVSVLLMAWHFNRQMKGIQQLSQSSKNSDSGSYSGITAFPEDIGFGTIQIGKIKLNTYEVLGKGCEGTFVFKGEFDARSVAVKRILPECFNFADREVELLRESDQHENVIRYYCMEQDKQFRYLALELCAATLQEYVEEKYVPNNITPMQILYQATSGLRHLHNLNIVHRDIKPNNVLISMPNSNGQVHAMISDFGLCKKLKLGRSSFSRRSGIIGTDGWIAPEMMTGETRTTCSVDIFSLGCLYYYVLTKGNHPFGDTIHRQANIMSGNYKLNGFESENHIAAWLIERMIDVTPGERPPIGCVLKHPLFWNESKILSFLQDVSDRVEKEVTSNYVVQNLEHDGANIVRGDWRIHIDTEVAHDLRKYRNYRGNSVRDLLRALRNKKHHYRELSEQAQRNLGEIPLNFVHYWTSRFPLLLIHTWLAMQCVKQEPIFRDYYESSYIFPELPNRYFTEDLSSLMSDNGISMQDESFLGKDVLLKSSLKPSNLFLRETPAVSPNKGIMENWRKERRVINLMNTHINYNNTWFQDWLTSDCHDEDCFNNWRQSEVANAEIMNGGEMPLVLPQQMTQEICSFFRKMMRQKPRAFPSQNFSPKKFKPKKPLVKKIKECRDDNSISTKPS